MQILRILYIVRGTLLPSSRLTAVDTWQVLEFVVVWQSRGAVEHDARFEHENNHKLKRDGGGPGGSIASCKAADSSERPSQSSQSEPGSDPWSLSCSEGMLIVE